MLMSDVASPLLTDLYQLNMIKAYLDHGQTQTAVFEFFVRKLSSRRGFLVAAGLEQASDFLEGLSFSAEEIDWLEQAGRFDRNLLDNLARFRFTGEVHAMPEGTVFFANEPILRVTAPLPEAQLAETRLINIMHFQSLIASKATRIVLAAPGKLLVGAVHMAPKQDFWQRGRATSRDLPERRRCWRTSCMASRPLAPWRIRSSRPTTTKARRLKTSPGHVLKT
jgi:nicotinic acid phosphoribosyltransferase